MADWYPQNIDARAAWHDNWNTHLTAFATKYNIGTGALATVTQDNLWMQYWVQARHDVDNQKQQVTRYFNEISGNNPSVDPPLPINFALTGTAPDEVAPGIEFRTREIARQIKGHSAYAMADGELLGIVPPDAVPPSFGTMQPDFTLRTLANFELEASFRKKGADALRFEIRHKGGNWQQTAFLLTSPGIFAVVPQEAGTAEQIEVRATFVEKNADVGNFSDIVTGFIAP